jgi:hypothetical protein
MKRLYVCGSFKFIREMKGLERKLKARAQRRLLLRGILSSSIVSS